MLTIYQSTQFQVLQDLNLRNIFSIFVNNNFGGQNKSYFQPKHLSGSSLKCLLSKNLKLCEYMYALFECWCVITEQVVSGKIHNLPSRDD